MERDGSSLALILLLGLAAAGAKLVYSFFPLFNLWDALFFTLVGWSLGRHTGLPVWLMGISLALPAVLLSAFFVARLGAANLWQGVGPGWALSVLLIPLAACFGAVLGRRSVLQRQGG